MSRTVFLLLFLVLIRVIPLNAQSGQFRFLKLDITHGLSNNQVTSFLKDSRGYMWFGTASGVNQFNGYTMKVFRNSISDSTSLMNNNIIKLFEDPNGNIWVTTILGPNIFQVSTEKFIRNSAHYVRQFSLPDGSIEDILKDKNGNFWFVHATEGLFVYKASTNKKTIHLIGSIQKPGSISSNHIASIGEDKFGKIWVVHKNGIIERLNASTLKVEYRSNDLQLLNNRQLNYRMMIDGEGDLWLNVYQDNKGVYFFDISSKKLKHIRSNSGNVKLSSNIIQGIVQDDRGFIWVGTDHGGVNILDKEAWTVRYLLHEENNPQSLSENTINALYKDNNGIIWLGAYKEGINYYHSNIFRFPLYKRNSLEAKGLPYNDFNRFVEDGRGNLWMGSNGGGLIYFNREENKYTQYLHNPNDTNSIGSNVIVSLFIDREKKLWIGTYYGGLSCFDGKKFTNYRHNPLDSTSISHDSVWEIFEDSHGKIWIGTLDGGLDQFDRNNNAFIHYPGGSTNSIHASYVSEIAEDKDRNVWIGTSYGLEKYNHSTGKFTHYLNNTEQRGSLSNNLIMAMYNDSRGFLWIGTDEGLNVFDPQNNRFYSYKMDDGLPHNIIVSIIEDNQGELWVGTPDGISNIKVEGTKPSNIRLTFTNFSETDGLQGKEFNENAAYKTSSGELIFGGSRGFNLFKPQDIKAISITPKVLFSDFYLFNKKVNIGEKINGEVILRESISETQAIELDYNSNVFAIEFTALDYFHPENNKFEYMLEGFDEKWTSTNDKSRRATYTNLNPGTYSFKVRLRNNRINASNGSAKLRITILPPWWFTKTAIFLYFISIFLIFYISRKTVQKRERRRFKIKEERKEAQQMHELDQMKIRFFTNISHEFRTPLTLILTPLEKILNQSADKSNQNQLQMIYRNAKRLLNLVNQLLDLRKLEFNEIKYSPGEGDIIQFLRDTTFSFSDISENKNISLSFKSSIQKLVTKFDEDKLEKILFNLLSNAFKFTPKKGSVAIEVNLVSEKILNDSSAIEIKVTDTGIGIPLENQEKIFERFFQNDLPPSILNQGSGIGLAITKEFVKLHGGQLTLISEPDKGSCFIIHLPIEITKEEIPQNASGLVQQEAELLGIKEGIEKDQEEVSKILLVEDNEDFRSYIKDILKDYYKVIEAGDGKEGLQQALEQAPGIIISDIMLPEMNGIELCKALRSNSKTSHIPVLLLTAKTSMEQKLEGYNTGAQDYIEKPFNVDILLLKIKSILKQQKAARKTFQQQIIIKGKDLIITSLDEKFIQKAIAIVEENISNAEFSVEVFSKEIGMSRIHLYRKLHALTEKSPVDFIRTIRLERACQLLKESQLTVSEIAYQVGYNNPKYFAKHFKEEYNMNPTEYRAGINNLKSSPL